MKKSQILIVAAGFSFLSLHQADAAKLTVMVDNISDEVGQIKVVVCDESTFLTHNCPFKQRVKAERGDIPVSFDNIPAGEWAVLAYHDSNMNDDLDRNFLGIPTEQFGFSNDPGYNHVPKFHEAEFTIGEQDLALNIKLSD